MKYAKIAALVPEGEHFDESAIINEGGYLSTAHLGLIEQALGEQSVNAEALEQANSQITDLRNEIDAAATNLETAQSALATANETIGNRDTRIAELESQLAEFTEGGSGQGSHVEGGAESHEGGEGGKKKITINHPDHPMNQVAARRVAAKTK